MWDTEMTLLLRHMLDDLEDTPKYSDDRLQQLLLVAATFVSGELGLSEVYDISAENYTIRPDPTMIDPRDDAFINLTVLRAMCFFAQSGLMKAANKHLFVKEGNVQFDGRGRLQNQAIVATNWCTAYNDAKWEYSRNISTPGIAIIGPYRSQVEAYLDYTRRINGNIL